MGKQAPAPGNYTGAAERTAAGSAAAVGAQTQANRPNISTPFGTQTWTQGPGGQWGMSQALSPEVQAALRQMQGTQIGGVGTGDEARQQAIDSAWNAAQARLNPMFAQREGALGQQLANQGLDMNSAAARGAQKQLGQQRSDAYSSALANAISEGNRTGSDVFRNNLMGQQNQMMLRGMPLNDLRSAMGFMQMPSFMGAGQAQGANYLGAMGMQDSAAMQRWLAENQANADAWGQGLGALGNLGGLFLL